VSPSDAAGITYPAELPITERLEEIAAAMRTSPVVIVAGETGSGKSTQLPKLCLALGRATAPEGSTRRPMIAHTQPRRLAARTVAERIAAELGEPIGGRVGYAVRFTDRVGPDTQLKVMTDGLLLAEIARDRDLRRYDTVIIDEAHERSLTIDFLLGYLHRLLPRRPDLKLLVTSATIDTARFAAHFGGAPVVEVSGRSHPVEVRYRPLGSALDDGAPGDADDPDAPVSTTDPVEAVCAAVQELCAEGPGDVLVFLAGEREIHDTAAAVRDLGLPDTEVLPLYARLSAAEQHRIFRPGSGRRIVLATNVAETSITVPRVRYVVDAGTARISRYSRRSKVQRLPIEPVSQASAAQRAGRCGRVAPGICIRLYDGEDLASRPAFTDPEILRTNLASVVLQMAALRLGEPRDFPFLDRPDPRAVADGIALLVELGALRPEGPDLAARLTPLGRRLARLPVDPRLGRMILEADRLGCVRELTVLASALSIQDPRERPAGAEQAAAEAHRRFSTDAASDAEVLLRLWDYVRSVQKSSSGNQFRKRLRTEFLHVQRIREWQDLHRQLRQVATDLGLRTNAEPAHPDHVAQALLSGLLSHVGLRDEARRDFLGARQARFALVPGSVLARRPPRWVVAAELVETNRLWGRHAVRIQPEWAERLGAHVVHRSVSPPQWDRDRGAATVVERVSLYGLPLVPARTIPYARIAPDDARRWFVQYALVDGDWAGDHPLVAHNRAVRAEADELERRARRRVLVDDADLIAFFDARVGPEVTSARAFEAWWRRAARRQREALRLGLHDLLVPAAADLRPEDFPDHWPHPGLVLPLTYVFDPGSSIDGVTVRVPLGVLNQVEPSEFTWHLPGHRRELVASLLRTLPRAVRRHLVPGQALHGVVSAEEFLARHGPGDGPLLSVLTRYVHRELDRAGLADADAVVFRPDALAEYLRPVFAIVDGAGAVLAAGRDLAALVRRFAPATRAALAAAAPVREQGGLTDWPGGELPRRVEVERDGNVLVGYPALVDEDGTVAVRVLASAAAQAAAMPLGTRRLLRAGAAKARATTERSLPKDTRIALQRNADRPLAHVLEDCLDAAVDDLVGAHGGPAWDADGFAVLTTACRAGLVPAATAAAGAAARILTEAAAVRARLRVLTDPRFDDAAVDVTAQLDRWCGPGFVTAAGVGQLDDVLRYVRALARRIEKLPGDLDRDRERTQLVRALEADWRDLVAVHPGVAARRIRRLLDELRVGLWAPAIGTAEPVSEQRVRRALADARRR
jgi:ATP-dependent helicase HrpA